MNITSFKHFEANLSDERTEGRIVYEWITRYVASLSPRAHRLANNRKDRHGDLITEERVERAHAGPRPCSDRDLHVCPFMADAIEKDVTWIGRRPEQDPREAIPYLHSLTTDFKTGIEPQVDPLDPSYAQSSSSDRLKNLILYFPEVEISYEWVEEDGEADRKYQADPRVHVVEDELKPHFRHAGLMLGLFYKGYPQGSVYNNKYKGVFSAPCWIVAVRHMQPHDSLFINKDDPAYEVYERVSATIASGG